MADLLCTCDYIPISYVGCGMMRRALLGLEPGSRIWLDVAGETLLFERIEDDSGGYIVGALKAVEPSIDAWQRLSSLHHKFVVELDFTERPLDAGRSSERWAGDDLPGATTTSLP